MTVEKRIGKRGTRWVAIVEHPRDPVTGKRVQRKKTFATRKLAEQWERSTRTALDQGDYHEPSVEAVATHLAHWLDTADMAPNTRKSYAGVIRRLINPAIGSVTLGKLTGRDVQSLYNA